MEDDRLLDKILRLIELMKDDEARNTAYSLATNNNVPLQKLQFWTAYMQGMREAYERMFQEILRFAPKKERPYIEAERNLCLSCYDACYDYHIGKYEIRYKDHIHDKKGKLVKCTAYFVKQAIVATEVKYTRSV